MRFSYQERGKEDEGDEVWNCEVHSACIRSCTTWERIAFLAFHARQHDLLPTLTRSASDVSHIQHPLLKDLNIDIIKYAPTMLVCFTCVDFNCYEKSHNDHTSLINHIISSCSSRSSSWLLSLCCSQLQMQEPSRRPRAARSGVQEDLQQGS